MQCPPHPRGQAQRSPGLTAPASQQGVLPVEKSPRFQTKELADAKAVIGHKATTQLAQVFCEIAQASGLPPSVFFAATLQNMAVLALAAAPEGNFERQGLAVAETLAYLLEITAWLAKEDAG